MLCFLLVCLLGNSAAANTGCERRWCTSSSDPTRRQRRVSPCPARSAMVMQFRTIWCGRRECLWRALPVPDAYLPVSVGADRGGVPGRKSAHHRLRGSGSADTAGALLQQGPRLLGTTGPYALISVMCMSALGTLWCPHASLACTDEGSIMNRSRWKTDGGSLFLWRCAWWPCQPISLPAPRVLG